MIKFIKSINRYIREEKGMSMILAVMLIFVVSVLATALYNYAMTEIVSVRTETDIEKAKYLARTGIISAVAAWKENGDKINASKTTTIYQRADGTFSSDSDDSVGRVDVSISSVTKTINEVTSTVTEFDATAVYNNTTQKMKASTSPISNELSLGWFDENTVNQTATLKGNEDSSSRPEINNFISNLLSAIFGSGSNTSNYKFKYSYFNGIAKCEPSPSVQKFVMSNNEATNKVIFTAQAIFMERPIDMAANDSRYNILVIQSKDIYFKGNIDLYYSPLRSSVGTIVISCPDGVGYKIDSKYYGKVFFEGDVTLHVRGLLGTTKYTIFKNGETYYFSQEAEGIDLIKYAIDNKNINVSFSSFYGGKKYNRDDMKLIPRTSKDAVPLSPEALTTIVWH